MAGCWVLVLALLGGACALPAPLAYTQALAQAVDSYNQRPEVPNAFRLLSADPEPAPVSVTRGDSGGYPSVPVGMWGGRQSPRTAGDLGRGVGLSCHVGSPQAVMVDMWHWRVALSLSLSPQDVQLSSLRRLNFTIMETRCPARSPAQLDNCDFKEDGVRVLGG